MNIPIIAAFLAATALLGGEVSGNMARQNRVARRDTVGAVLQVSTITAADAEDLADYSVRFNSTTPGFEGITYTAAAATTGASATAEQLRDLALAAIRDTPNVWTLISDAQPSSTNAILITWLKGHSGTIDFPLNPGTQLSAVVTTAAASAPQYVYGRAVEVRAAPGTNERLVGDGIRPVQAVAGPVSVTTLTYVGTGNASMVVNQRLPFGGLVSRTLTWAMGANLAASVANLAAAYTTAFGSTTQPPVITSNAGAGTVTATWFPGNEVSTSGETTASGTIATVTTAGAALPRFALVIREGRTPAFESLLPTTEPVGPLPGQDVLTADPSGSDRYLIEATGDALDYGAEVYVESTAGATNGRMYPTPSATRIPWREASFVALDSTQPTRAHLAL